MPATNVLIIDDDQVLIDTMSLGLADHGLTIHNATCLECGLSLLDTHHIEVVLLDLGLPDAKDLEVLDRILAHHDQPEVIVLSGQSDVNIAVQCLQRGAFHYHSKPATIDELTTSINRASTQRRLKSENSRLKETIKRSSERDLNTDTIAASAIMRDIVAEARHASQVDAPILIEGETGVGKEVIASLIHSCSPRADGPFNAINCGAMPDNLIDAEFFGHEKGVFTGADTSRPGIIEVSHSGTLLLDEIGEITLDAQVRLLRVLEQGAVRRIGGRKEIPVDVRIIASTHRNLEEMVAAGTFREDLYHRLVVLRLTIPPLRERTEDIVPLAESFVDQLCKKYRQSRMLDVDTHELLQTMPWPGNIRELKNVIERGWFAATKAGSKVIGHSHFVNERCRTTTRQIVQTSGFTVPDNKPVNLHDLSQQYTNHILELCHNDRAMAAEILGVSERTLYRRLESCS